MGRVCLSWFNNFREWEQSRAGQSRAGQSRAEQSGAGQSRAEQSGAGQSRAEQSRTLWFCPQQGDLRLSGPPSGQGAGSGARTRDRRVPADLRADSQATVPPTPP
ncbi:hemolysin-type calcium-binding region:rtx n-terminal domain protein [Plakobranchus ocellatus]|uniref:Hemolysin-type calcium-binding region:rtx n-terminal domain protein n=1 Tax=Plakobranchus ocellatus TaxID=259542 RepID=A0AAV3YXS4_9GAST|nr:hemolysin-type calcium-binding region:rtx n-terminal domain protein [Plakobranchus ocellatus]